VSVTAIRSIGRRAGSRWRHLQTARARPPRRPFGSGRAARGRRSRDRRAAADQIVDDDDRAVFHIPDQRVAAHHPSARYFSMKPPAMARPSRRLSATRNFSARFTPPASGDSTAISSAANSAAKCRQTATRLRVVGAGNGTRSGRRRGYEHPWSGCGRHRLLRTASQRSASSPDRGLGLLVFAA